MSQHLFHTHRGQTPICVTIGWDRPIGHFFMYIEETTQCSDDSDLPDPHDDDPALIYNNLDEPDAFELDLDHFRRVLMDLGITVPEVMFEQTMQDRDNNIGNRTVFYTADGRMHDERPAS